MKNKQEIREEIRRELEELAPGLELPDRDGFEAPPGYFETLSQRLAPRLRQADAEPEVKPGRSWLQTLTEWLSALRQPRLAAGFALLLLVAAVWWWLPRGEQPAEMEMANLSSEAAARYVEAHIEEFDTRLLLEFAFDQENRPTIPLTEEEVDYLLEEYLNEMEAEDLEQWL